ncbi:Uncharacterised protein [Cronobacter sakazakii]|nr:Uncharacterised protein [Cronobacter sakazakii]
MKLTLDSLKQAGAFTGRPVEKEITWKQGGQELTATVYIRPMGYYTAMTDVMAAQGHIDGLLAELPLPSVTKKESRYSPPPILRVKQIQSAARWTGSSLSRCCWQSRRLTTWERRAYRRRRNLV